MSTFTKILVILLSIASVFLCGTVVMYVATSANYKDRADELKIASNLLRADWASAKTQYDAQTQKMKELEKTLNERILLLEGEKSELEIELGTARRENLASRTKMDGLTAVLTGIKGTIGNMELSREETRKLLDRTRADSIEDRQFLNETIAKLLAKTVQLQDLGAQRKRLIEEKDSLEKQLEDVAIDTEIDTVTPLPGKAQPATESTASGSIKGLIKEVKESLVTISVGSADGVKKNMTFHVTRGSDFICDITITNVDTSKSAGVIELIASPLIQPRVGDNVTTEEL